MAEDWKKKLENFWYYHKKQVLILCLALFLFSYAGYLLAQEEPEPVLYGEAVNLEISETDQAVFCKRALEYLELDDGENRIFLGTGMHIDVQNPEKNALTGSLENISVQIFSHELDFLVCPESVMDYFAELGALEETDNSVYGVLANSFFSESETMHEEDIWFCILKNSEKKEYVRQMKKMLEGEAK